MTPAPTKVPVVAAALVCGPVAAAALFMAWLVGSHVFGVGPFRPDPPRTLVEAAVVGDAGTVVLRLRLGDDPNRRYRVAPGQPGSGRGDLQPLEAAVLSGDPDMVALLQREGAVLAPEDARRLACLMAAHEGIVISRMLEGAAWDATQCPPSEQ